MYKVILDWDKTTKKGVIVSNVLEDIRLHFSIPNPHKRIIDRKYESNRTPSRLYAITATGRFELGMLQSILEFLNTSNGVYEPVITEPLTQQAAIGVQLSKPVQDYLPRYTSPLRTFQETGVQIGAKAGRGIFVVGTGGGKTLLMNLLLECFRQERQQSTALIILPAHLIKQTTQDFISYGTPKEDIWVWSGSNDLIKAPITITSYKTACSRLVSFKSIKPKVISSSMSPSEYTTYLKEHKANEDNRRALWNKDKKRYQRILSTIDLLLVDEVHTLRKENKSNRVIKMIPTANKFGFTGTMPDNKIDQWHIQGTIGPIIEEVSAKNLEDSGYVTPAVVQVLRIMHRSPIRVTPNIEDPTKAYREEYDWLFHNDFRNSIIYKLACKVDNNILVVVDSLEYGQLLYELFTSKCVDKQVYWIKGEVDTEERERIRQLMEQTDNIICVAMSKVFSTGVSVNNLYYIMFTHIYKAKIKLIQSIGRGRRLHSDKKEVIIFDISDNTRYSSDHLNSRLALYEGESIPVSIRDIYEQ